MSNTEGAEDRLLSPRTVAGLLDMHVDTLKNWRSKRWGPKFIRLDGGQIRYWESDVASYLNERTVSTTVIGA